ncbi:NAD-dependent deacetylase hst3 [Lecanora helva]
MAILEVCEDSSRELQNIANSIAAAKKVVVITGAGISTNCGIPDFRSDAGLYSLIQAQRDAASSKKVSKTSASGSAASPQRCRQAAPVESSMKQRAKPPLIPSNFKGKDLFDAQIWKDPTSTSVFYSFIASLRKTIQEDIRKTTPTHRFIRLLRDRRKLVRCYTQNIDGLEARHGLCTDMDRSKGNRARFTKKSMQRPRDPGRELAGGDLDGGCEVVQLHGDLNVLRCTLCQQTCLWEEHDHAERLLAGKASICHTCIATNLDRQDRGKRGTKMGTLRPNIVLYGEEHPSADAIGTITSHDLGLAPDLLLVLGTSLHVHGLKVLVKEFAKSVHARAGGKGKVIFVNLSKPPESVWKDVFDYWISMDCDAWIRDMKRHRPDIFQVQDELQLRTTKPKDKSSIKSTASVHLSAVDEDKENRGPSPTATPRKYKRQPRVLVTPKKSQSSPLVESELVDSVRLSTKKSEVPAEQAQLDNQLQLPTPPLTIQRERFQTPSKKRSLAENYQNMFSTPSKRRKTTLTVWEDEESH